MRINKNLLFTICLLIMVITGIVGYSYINGDINSTSTITVNKYDCTQSNLYDRLACMSVMDNVKSKYVSSSKGIDFEAISSDTNGKGIYTLSSSAGDTYPIHYYRGNVVNNNVKFAGYCWKIVRTTDTGGTKLLYNGEPDGSGHCTATSTDTETEKSNFGASATPAAAGYMYGQVYSRGAKSNYLTDIKYDSSYQYVQVTGGDNPTYQYELDDPKTLSDKSEIYSNRYTCLNNTGVCTQISYVFFIETSQLYYFNLTNNKTIYNLFDEMLTNSTNTQSSIAKNKVDSFYTTNLSSKESQLEDTIWCNDREIYDYGSVDPSLTQSKFTYFIGYNNSDKSIIKLNCSKNDSFTVNETTTGNGKLTKMTGLITVDEVIMAGGVKGIEDTNYYLYTGEDWSTMTPSWWGHSNALLHMVKSDGSINVNNYVNTSYGIRPMISLNHSQVISSGEGTQDNPYIIN